MFLPALCVGNKCIVIMQFCSCLLSNLAPQEMMGTLKQHWVGVISFEIHFPVKQFFVPPIYFFVNIIPLSSLVKMILIMNTLDCTTWSYFIFSFGYNQLASCSFHFLIRQRAMSKLEFFDNSYAQDVKLPIYYIYYGFV